MKPAEPAFQPVASPTVPIPAPPSEPVAQTKNAPETVVSPAVVSSSGGSKQTPSLFRKKEEAKVETPTPEVPKRETLFDQEALDVAWKLFADVRSKMNMGDAEKLVLGRKLQKREGNEVQIILGSQLEMSILEKVEQDLVQFMRKTLSNDYIFLTKSVAEQNETQMLYTSRDKYAYMVEQNPALKELKDRLGLDFEY